MPPQPVYRTPQKGNVGESALDSLTLLLSCGDLHLAQPIPDDSRFDRVLVRLGRPVATAVQIKVATFLARGRYITARVRAPDFARRDRSGFFVFAAPLIGRSPWIETPFYLIPAKVLGPVPPSGFWHLALPVDRRRGSKWDPYAHPLTELATVFSRALDGGRAYPFPPSRSALKRLSAPAVGRLFENEFANLLTAGSDGDLEAWRPFTDLGQDLAITDASGSASLHIQVKGSLYPDARGRVHAQIEEDTFSPARFNLVAVLSYDVDRLRLADYGWLIGSDELARLKLVRHHGFLEFMAPPDPASRNKFRPWLYHVDEMPGVLRTALDTLRERGPRAAIATRRDAVARARLRLQSRARRDGR